MSLSAALILAAAAHGSANARQKLAGTEWLCDVIIRSQFQQQHFVGNIRFGTEHDHRHYRSLPLDLAAYIVSRQTR